ncbi:MAG: class I tRNA ligase family protein, partial [Candidatus Omnitrophota bacterium]
MQEISPRYNPKEVENKWFTFWEERKLFEVHTSSPKEPYCIVIPPPNITGSLHMGHALGGTLQDIIIRFKRMQGFDALWIPGCDHAGIATENVIEREL